GALCPPPGLQRREAGGGHRLPAGHELHARRLQHHRLAAGERGGPALPFDASRRGRAPALRAFRGGGAGAAGGGGGGGRGGGGAGRGIGRAIALALAAEGADLALVARTEADLEAVAAEVRGLGRRALVATCDMTEEPPVAQLAERVLAEYGRVDVLVNNAGW